MTATVRVLETVTLVCPLAVQFWDDALSQPVRGGLAVSAWPVGAPEQSRDAVQSRTVGAYSFAHLPGLDRSRPFVVQVVDAENRFQPCRFRLPLPVAGVLGRPACLGASSPPRPSDLMVPLFPAPHRRVPPEIAVVRADLWDAANKQPASWVLVEAGIEGRIYRGIADAKGRLLLAFPYPEPLAYIPGSLSSPPHTAIDGRTWDVQLSAFYQPLLHTPEVPDLCQVLGQPPATLWADSSLITPLGSLTLLSGRDLIARSLDAISRGNLPNLLLTPVASPLDSPI